MAPSTYSDALRALLSPLTSDQWVQCDSCEIWRRVPKRIADALGDDEQWFCNLNPYDYFNRCDAPQEIEDDEIDVVLQAQAAAEEYKLAAVERAAAEKAEKAAAAAAAAAREHVSYNMSVTDGNQTRRQFQPWNYFLRGAGLPNRVEIPPQSARPGGGGGGGGGAPKGPPPPPVDETEFEGKLRRFHESRGGHLKIPVFCRGPLDLAKVFNEVRKRDGYEEVCRHKRWMDVCRTLGKNLSGQTSAGFQMRRNYETCLLEYEKHCREAQEEFEAGGGGGGGGGGADENMEV